jgi:hypothetical protein
VLHAQQRFDLALEPGNVLPLVGEPPAVENVVNEGKKMLAVADIRSSHVQLVFEKRLPAEDGKFIGLFASGPDVHTSFPSPFSEAYTLVRNALSSVDSAQIVLAADLCAIYSLSGEQ